jgi:DNA-binding CsgD family transcriptional regulator
LSTGRSDKEVARNLGLSDLTARTYRTRLFRKTRVNNICALLYQSWRHGWIDFPETAPA